MVFILSFISCIYIKLECFFFTVEGPHSDFFKYVLHSFVFILSCPTSDLYKMKLISVFYSFSCHIKVVDNETVVFKYKNRHRNYILDQQISVHQTLHILATRPHLGPD